MDAEAGGGGSACALVKPEGRRVAALGEARGARIHQQDILEILFEFPDVCVAVQVGVDFRVRILFFEVQRIRGEALERVGGETFRRVDVTVAQKEVARCTILVGVFHDGVAVLDREIEHHQVHVGVAVAAHGGDAFLVRCQRFDDSHRAVPCRERIARAVVERVAQQKDAVAAELFKEGKRLPRGNRRTMNIGENKGFHCRLEAPGSR